MGTFDLKDNSLITLKEVSMEEMKRRNEPKLAAKAGLLRDLVMRLKSQNKSVVVTIPPHGEDTIELHHHCTGRRSSSPPLRTSSSQRSGSSTWPRYFSKDHSLFSSQCVLWTDCIWSQCVFISRLFMLESEENSAKDESAEVGESKVVKIVLFFKINVIVLLCMKK